MNPFLVQLPSPIGPVWIMGNSRETFAIVIIFT